jgi:Transposase DDE domain group 1
MFFGNSGWHVDADYLAAPLRVVHRLPGILRARIFAIACGDEDADDLDWLRSGPAFMLACGQWPDSGYDLCSQPTMSRWENAPNHPPHGRSISIAPAIRRRLMPVTLDIVR